MLELTWEHAMKCIRQMSYKIATCTMMYSIECISFHVYHNNVHSAQRHRALQCHVSNMLSVYITKPATLWIMWRSWLIFTVGGYNEIATHHLRQNFSNWVLFTATACRSVSNIIPLSSPHILTCGPQKLYDLTIHQQLGVLWQAFRSCQFGYWFWNWNGCCNWRCC